jgi:hypothetical protein
MDLNNVIGILFIGFEDLNQKYYGDFIAAEFSCSVTVRICRFWTQNLETL